MRTRNKNEYTDHSLNQAWKFVAMSQGQARQRSFKADYILISIQDPDEPQAELPEPPNCCGILRLQFDDIQNRKDGLVLFSSEQALEILDFVHAHRAEVTMIACHCKMGMCRSPAVLAALAAVMGQEDSFLRDERGRPKYRPNRYVYETLVHEGRRHELGAL